jgi:hypothetical protein
MISHTFYSLPDLMMKNILGVNEHPSNYEVMNREMNGTL